MGHSLQKLTALAVARAKIPGCIADGGGLYLQVSPTGTKSWVYRFSFDGRRPEMGLGPYPAISLATARELAAGARTLVKTGQDPIAARDAERARRRLEEARGVTWDQAVEQFIGDHEVTWKNSKHRQQWRNTLKTYASPTMGTISVAAISTPEVTKVLDPIWHTKPETASRVRGRIERVLDWSKVRGYRTGENPARWRGHLDKVYPARGKVRKVQHHAALAIDDLPALYDRLCKAQGIAALALRFVILTAARAGEVTGARREQEIDLEGSIWTVPPERMKAGKEHKVPLSGQALGVLHAACEFGAGGFVFPGRKSNKPLSIAALSKALHTAGGGNATVHGFRSTFKDWASERTSFPAEVSEMALAHSIGDKVEAAYRRGELMQKRAKLMDAWAAFVTTPRASSDVVPLRQAGPRTDTMAAE